MLAERRGATMHLRWAPTGLLCVLAVGAAPAVAETGAESPFQVPREQVVEELRTVALAPLWVPKDLIVDPVDRAHLLDLVTQRLRQAGIRVVPPAQTGPVLEAAKAALGGYIDAAGSVDMERYTAVQGEALKTLRERTGADQLLVVTLTGCEVPVSAGRASWDGVEEDAAVPLARRSWAAKRGKLWALSVGAWLHGDGGKLLYRHKGGLRLLFHYARNEKTIPVPDADLLADDDRNGRAVRIALKPLLPPADPARTASTDAAVHAGSSP
jgi:hypothetical protein